ARARVVKSVAGFDVHKLSGGSRGLLFAASLLHLKLRPRPQASADFTTAPAPAAAAVPQFLALRQLAPAPVRLALLAGPDGCRVAGRFAEIGRASCRGRGRVGAAAVTISGQRR